MSWPRSLAFPPNILHDEHEGLRSLTGLDDGGICGNCFQNLNKDLLVGPSGVEPLHQLCESCILPIDHGPIVYNQIYLLLCLTKIGAKRL